MKYNVQAFTQLSFNPSEHSQRMYNHSSSVEKVPLTTRVHINSITLRENPFVSICLSHNRDWFTKLSFLYCFPDTVTSLYNEKLLFFHWFT